MRKGLEVVMVGVVIGSAEKYRDFYRYFNRNLQKIFTLDSSDPF